ncbi:hypothetical protein C8R45DRAFT_1090200 [Mycena sanguinolenta]|nr:hypothetical protein C8R45DRAFT_1090200 [Mycena sanguinolenta]
MLQEEERKAAEWKEAVQKAKVEEKREAEWKQQEKMVKNALEEISAQLRAAKMKEVVVAVRSQTLVERDAHVWDIFSRTRNEELTPEDVEELKSILRRESLDNSDVPDESNNEVGSEPDPNEVQTGKKRKHVSRKKSAAGKAPVKKPRRAETSGKATEEGCRRLCVGTSAQSMWGMCLGETGVRGPDEIPAQDRRLVNKPWKDAGGTQRQRPVKQMPMGEPSEPPVPGPSRTRLCQHVERLEADVRNALQMLSMERRFKGGLATEIVQWEPENQWPRVYLSSINWDGIGEGEESEEQSGDEVPDDRKEPEELSSSESLKESWVESWQNDVVPEAPEGKHLVEEQPDDQMQVDEVNNAPVDGEMGDGEMQVDPPAFGSSLVDPLQMDGIKIEVRIEAQMLMDLGRQLAGNWLSDEKATKHQEAAQLADECRKLAEQWKALEKEEEKLQKQEERQKTEGNQEPSMKKETEEGEVPPPALPCPVVRVREVDNVVEILDSDDGEDPESPEIM